MFRDLEFLAVSPYFLEHRRDHCGPHVVEGGLEGPKTEAAELETVVGTVWALLAQDAHRTGVAQVAPTGFPGPMPAVGLETGSAAAVRKLFFGPVQEFVADQTVLVRQESVPVAVCYLAAALDPVPGTCPAGSPTRSERMGDQAIRAAAALL